YNSGKKVITQVLETFSSQAKVSVNNKKYNLACKFYEYIFEPTISSQNSTFYNLGFHKFISNLLYIHFQYRIDDYAEDIFENFYTLMKRQNAEKLTYFFESLTLLNLSSSLDIIKTFCIHQHKAINAELDSLNGTGVGKWILDLTTSSVFSLLGEWGQEFHQLDVFCDVSKPLQEQIEIFHSMVGREEKLFLEVAGKKHATSFNLVRLPQMADSKDRPGIQIADIFAGAFSFVCRESLKGTYSNHPKEWIHHLDTSMSPYSVMPSDEHIDWNEFSVRLNYLILEELANRSKRKIPLLKNIDSRIKQMHKYIYLKELQLL
ncbi:MAG: DUF3800 domain-containing protein, partial [Ignavibacteria bacterium]|nr:DUF3800 domain-containing protein [Ignavibacteria bacterium]